MANTKDITINALIRARLIRQFPELSADAADLGLPETPGVGLVLDGVATVFNVSGRYLHSVQSNGLDTNETWQIKASLNNQDFNQIGSDVADNAPGFMALPSGVYGWIKAEITEKPVGLIIQYVGGGSNAVLTIEDGHILVDVTGAADDIDLDLSEYETYTELAAAVELAAGGSAYTCSVSTDYADDAPTDLVLVEDLDIDDAPTNLLRESAHANILLGSMR